MRINERELMWFARNSKRVDAQGYLYKRGVVNTNAKKRWFVLKGNLLFYYKSHEDMAPIGLIILERCRVETSGRLTETDQYEFKLVFDGSDTREYQLAADTEEDMMRWMKLITEASYEYLRAVVSDLKRRVEEEERKLEEKKGTAAAPVPQAGAIAPPPTGSARPLSPPQGGQGRQASGVASPAGNSSSDLNISHDFVDLGAESQIGGGYDPFAPVAPPRKSHSHPKPTV